MQDDKTVRAGGPTLRIRDPVLIPIKLFMHAKTGRFDKKVVRFELFEVHPVTVELCGEVRSQTSITAAGQREREGELDGTQRTRRRSAATMPA